MEPPDENDKNFEYILPKDVKKESFMEVSDELIPQAHNPEYVVDFEIIGNTTVNDYEVSIRKQKRYMIGNSNLSNFPDCVFI